MLGSMSEFVLPPFEVLVSDSDLIVQGSLKKRLSYLSSDEQEMYTDYEVLPDHVIAERRVLSTSRPEPAMPVIFRVRGGEMTISGVVVKVYQEEFLPLPVDRPLFLFLKYNERIRKHELLTHLGAAFELDAGKRLKALTKTPHPHPPRHVGMGVDEVVREIRASRR